MSRYQDIEIYQGDDFTDVAAVTDNGAPADLTGYTARSQIRRQVADADPVIVTEMFTAIAGHLVLLSIPHTVTVGFTGNYVWDLQLSALDGTVHTLLHGRVKTLPEVTR